MKYEISCFLYLIYSKQIKIMLVRKSGVSLENKASINFDLKSISSLKIIRPILNKYNSTFFESV
jgi:hypothetical protein